METQTQTKPVKAKETASVTVENFIRAESDMYFTVVLSKKIFTQKTKINEKFTFIIHFHHACFPSRFQPKKSIYYFCC